MILSSTTNLSRADAALLEALQACRAARAALGELRALPRDEWPAHLVEPEDWKEARRDTRAIMRLLFTHERSLLIWIGRQAEDIFMAGEEDEEDAGQKAVDG